MLGEGSVDTSDDGQPLGYENQPAKKDVHMDRVWGMTSILAGMYTAYRHPDRERDPQDKPIEFAQGFTDDEKTFITQNRSQLGRGTAKQAAEYSRSMWAVFMSLPLVFQLLIGVCTIVSIIVSPFVIMFIIRALQAPDTQVRMIATLGCFVVVLCATVVVLVWL